jgi:hypothetical protein
LDPGGESLNCIVVYGYRLMAGSRSKRVRNPYGKTMSAH